MFLAAYPSFCIGLFCYNLLLLFTSVFEGIDEVEISAVAC